MTHKAVSKWETAKGLPDITLIEPLAKALGVSVPELFFCLDFSNICGKIEAEMEGEA